MPSAKLECLRFGNGIPPLAEQGDIMRKQPKKLVLSKETVRILDGELKGVHGGSAPGDTASACLSFCNSVCRFCLDEPLGP
jgi:hypothetical protein